MDIVIRAIIARRVLTKIEWRDALGDSFFANSAGARDVRPRTTYFRNAYYPYLA